MARLSCPLNIVIFFLRRLVIETCQTTLTTLDSMQFDNVLLPALAQVQGFLRVNNQALRALPVLYDISCHMDTYTLFEIYERVQYSGIVDALTQVSIVQYKGIV